MFEDFACNVEVDGQEDGLVDRGRAVAARAALHAWLQGRLWFCTCSRWTRLMAGWCAGRVKQQGCVLLVYVYGSYACVYLLHVYVDGVSVQVGHELLVCGVKKKRRAHDQVLAWLIKRRSPNQVR